MRPPVRPIDTRFQALADDLDKNGLEAYYYGSELWFYEEGLSILKRRADLPTRVDDPQPEELKFRAIVLKHFPQLK